MLPGGRNETRWLAWAHASARRQACVTFITVKHYASLVQGMHAATFFLEDDCQCANPTVQYLRVADSGAIGYNGTVGRFML